MTVDPDDENRQHPEHSETPELLELLDDDSADDIDEDSEDSAADVDDDDLEEYENLAESLGLPERLPALWLPPTAELAVAARESELLRKVGALATWVGERRAVTEDGDLTEPDSAEAAELLGVDAAELLLCWEVALATDLVVVSADDGEADGNPDLWPTGDDREDVGTWTAAFSQLLVSLDLDAELAGEEDLAFESTGSLVLPLFLMRNAGVPVAELREIVQDLAVEHLETDEAWESWVAEHGEPADVLLARLTDHGAVAVEIHVHDHENLDHHDHDHDHVDEEFARLTSLGLLAVREELVEGGIEIPLLPALADMTAVDLLDAVGGLTEDELTDLTEKWLALRAPGAAATELLAAAADADPEPRVHAATVLGDVPGTPWETVLDTRSLRPYALVALKRDLDPDSAAWLLVDLLVASGALAGYEDPETIESMFASAVPAGQEQEVLAVAWRLPHPETHDVLALVGTHHPDKQVAKAARTAAHKARSGQPPRG
jgi:hypothetical protein